MVITSEGGLVNILRYHPHLHIDPGEKLEILPHDADEDVGKIAHHLPLYPADNPEIDIGYFIGTEDKDVARVEITVEGGELEYLFEEEVRHEISYLLPVDALLTEPFKVVDLDPADPLHGQYLCAGKLPEYLRYHDPRIVFKILSELFRVASLKGEVHLLLDGL